MIENIEILYYLCLERKKVPWLLGNFYCKTDEQPVGVGYVSASDSWHLQLHPIHPENFDSCYLSMENHIILLCYTTKINVSTEQTFKGAQIIQTLLVQAFGKKFSLVTAKPTSKGSEHCCYNDDIIRCSAKQQCQERVCKSCNPVESAKNTKHDKNG